MFSCQKSFMLGWWLKRDFSVNLCPFFKDQNVRRAWQKHPSIFEHFGKCVFFPLESPRHLEKFKKIGVGHSKCQAYCTKCWPYRPKWWPQLKTKELPCSNGLHVVRRRYCWRSRQFSSWWRMMLISLNWNRSRRRPLPVSRPRICFITFQHLLSIWCWGCEILKL